MRNKSRYKLELFFAVLVGIWVIYEAVEEFKAKDEIRLNKGQTIGFIIDYKIVGTDNHYVHYEYYVDGKRYDKNISAMKIFKECYYTKDCIGRRFVVYYSKKIPKKVKLTCIKRLNKERFTPSGTKS